MADKKITQLPASTVPLAGTEVLPIVQGGVTKQVSVVNLTAGRAISATEATLTTGNLVIGTSGKGIDFSAVTNPSATNEILTQYAEGTWTPTLEFGGASTGITYAAQVGTYTRIGNLVVARFTIVLSNKGSATGAATINGLPFTVAGIAPGAATTIYASNFAANAPQIGYAGNATTSVTPTAFNASGTVGSLDTDFANNTRLDMWVQYFA